MKKKQEIVPLAAATPRSRAMPSAAALRSSARSPGTVSVPSRGTPTESGPALAMLALLGREKGMCIAAEEQKKGGWALRARQRR